MEVLNDPEVRLWVITPLLIFVARVCDVALGTIRIISVSRGRRYLAPILGFFEILIWLLAIREIFANMDHVAAFMAYALGFAAGNLAGLWLEERIALGHLAIRVITAEDSSDLVTALRAAHFGVTTVAAQGQSGSVQLVFLVIERKEYERVMKIVAKTHPKGFVSVQDVRSASEGVFPKGEYKTPLRISGRKSR